MDPRIGSGDAFHDTTVISVGSISGLVDVSAYWPTYTPDAYDGA